MTYDMAVNGSKATKAFSLLRDDCTESQKKYGSKFNIM